MYVVVTFDSLAIHFAPIEHVADVAKIFDANAFTLLGVVDIHKLSPLLTFTEYLIATHEIISSAHFTILFEPLDRFHCGHGFAKVDFVVEHHDVGAPELLFGFGHLNHSIVSVLGKAHNRTHKVYLPYGLDIGFA